MVSYALRLVEDRLQSGVATPVSLPVGNRVIYVVEGEVTITAGGNAAHMLANAAWYGAGPCSLAAASTGARLWRWELVSRPAPGKGLPVAAGVVSTEKLSHEVALDVQQQYLMRCDRVDFPPGGIAYTHTHQGPGIRCLLFGEFTVEVHGSETRFEAGGAWFESGPEPVYAIASEAEPAAFVRVMILPRALAGKSSIRYVKPEDQDKPKPQQYTIFLDEAIG